MSARENVRVLIAEGDYLISEMIKVMLKDIGYTIVGQAMDGQQAVEMTAQLVGTPTQPDVVLMDIEMPDIGGIEAMQLIQESCPTPVVVLTAYETEELVAEAGAVGAGAYLVKPPEAREMERAITIAMARFDDMMALRQAEDELQKYREHLEELVAVRTAELQAANAQLERDIAARVRAEEALRHRNVQLQTAAKVSRAASSILDVDRLIWQAVELIRERFGLYYVALFLVDTAQEFAVLHAGTGETGRQMVAQGHKLEVGGTSMVGQCVARAEARIALDVGKEATRFDNPLLPDTHSEMALPLCTRGQVIGALSVQSIEEAAFDEASIAVMQVMADQLATAIANARLYTSAQQELAERKRAEEALQESRADLERSHQALADRVTELEALHHISVAMSSTLETEVLLQFIVERAVTLSNAASCSILLPDEETGELVFHAAADRVAGMRVPPGRGIVARALRQGTPQVVNDVTADPNHYARIGQESGLPTRSELAVPLLVGDKAIGVLAAVNKRQGRFTDQDCDLFVTLSGHAASAIENARLFELAQQEITERVRAEEELRRHRDHLDELVQERTAELTKAIEQLEREVAERVRAEKALRESEEKHRALAENSPNGIFISDAERIIYTNQRLCEITGFSRDELLNMSDPVESLFAPEEWERVLAYARSRLGGGPTPTCYEARGIHKNGEEVLLKLTVSSIVFSGRRVLQGTVEDITERKRAEEQIKASLQEKGVLLKEIHHRVKNNLQVVSSLLNLQAGCAEDEQVVDMLQESRNRIRSMALVHEKLYRSPDLARVDFAEYIRNLAAQLFSSYQVRGRGITLKIEIADVALGVDTAVPCGLIVNELLSNALKYAFPPPFSPPMGGKKEGREIRVGLCSDKAKFTLTVGDNGVGFPPDLDFRNTESLGLQLVATLVEQLDGSIELDRGDGTTFKIEFTEQR